MRALKARHKNWDSTTNARLNAMKQWPVEHGWKITSSTEMNWYKAQGASKPGLFLYREVQNSKMELHVREWTTTTSYAHIQLAVKVEAEAYSFERNEIPIRTQRNLRIIQKARDLWKDEIPTLREKMRRYKDTEELERFYKLFSAYVLRK